jgi:hypothetical protein
VNDALLAELREAAERQAELLAGLAEEQHAALLAYAEANAEAWRRFMAEQHPPANEPERQP